MPQTLTWFRFYGPVYTIQYESTAALVPLFVFILLFAIIGTTIILFLIFTTVIFLKKIYAFLLLARKPIYCCWSRMKILDLSSQSQMFIPFKLTNESLTIGIYTKITMCAKIILLLTWIFCGFVFFFEKQHNYLESNIFLNINSKIEKILFAKCSFKSTYKERSNSVNTTYYPKIVTTKFCKINNFSDSHHRP